MKRVLVFDSGVGGLSVLDAIVAKRLPVALDYAADNAWLPYGEKSDAALKKRVPALLTALVEARAPDLVVVACNTASTIALEEARAAIKVPVVGVVPPIKPAAERTKTGVIGLLATPATVSRAYTDDLVARFAAGVRVVRHGSTALVAAAEAKLAGRAADPAAIQSAIDGLFGAGDPIDVVALACTHFPLLADELAAAAPRGVTWLDSGEAIARRVQNLLAQTDEGAPQCEAAFFTDVDAARPLREAFGGARFFCVHSGAVCVSNVTGGGVLRRRGRPRFRAAARLVGCASETRMPSPFGEAPLGLVSQIMNLATILTRPAVLRVPLYQRPFTWTQKEVSKLLDDLWEAYRASAHYYFIGQIVFIQHGRDLDLADGQQRLATLTMLFAYARDELKEAAPAIQSLILAAGTVGRLRLRPADEAFYAHWVQTPGNFKALATLDEFANDAQECMALAAREISEALDGVSPVELESFIRYVARCSLFNVVDCAEPGGAATFFVTMNYRGKSLSGPDILKGVLLGSGDLTDKQVNDFSEKWDDLEDRAGRENYERMLRYVPLFHKAGPIISPGDVGALRELLQRRDGGIPAFLENDLPGYGKAMRQICHASVEAGAHSADINRRIRCLHLVEREMWEPLAVKYLSTPGRDPAHIARFFQLYERFIAACVLSQVDTKTRRARLQRAWSKIGDDKELTGPNGALDLTPAIRARLLARLSNSSSRDSLRRYLMLRINGALGEPLPGDADAYVEHILPKSWSDDWKRRFPRDAYQEFANMIGNYTLLTDTQNKAAENKSFADKRKIYFDERYPARALTRDLEKVSDWNVDALDERHERLIRIMSNEWELSPRAA